MGDVGGSEYRPILTRVAEEEAFSTTKIIRHHYDVIRSRDVIGNMRNRNPIGKFLIPIGCPLSGLVSEIFSPKVADKLTESQTDTRTDNKGRLKLALANQ